MDHTRLKPAIILVAPQLGLNIGAAARAMMNCGLSDLRIVNPRDGWPNQDARSMAANAVELVDNATLFDNFDAAIADLSYVIATTARQRDMVKPVLDPKRAAEMILGKENLNQKSGIVFGPERSGLENVHIIRSNALLTVPLNTENTSLNLAQAVLLVGYEWFQIQRKADDINENLDGPKEALATRGEIDNLLNRLESALDETGFFGLPDKKPRMVQNIRNIFERDELTTQEVNTLHGIFKALKNAHR